MGKRLTYEYVKEQIEKEGYELLSKEYSNNSSKLLLQCPEKHIAQISYGKFQTGVRCLSCWKIRKKEKYTKSFDYVKDYIESRNYELISDKYVNNRQKLTMVCPEKHTISLSFSSFQQNIRCPKCSHRKRAGKRKHSFDYVKEYIEKNNDKLLDNAYINSATKLNLLCPKSHRYSITFNSYKAGHRCKICYHKSLEQKSKYDFDYVKSFIRERGFELISKEYIKAIKPLQIRCSKGHKFEMSFTFFKLKQRCPLCSVTGFKFEQPGSIYYIKILLNGEKYYKIGITNKPIRQRVKNIHCSATILWAEEFLIGRFAFEKEQQIIKKYSKYLLPDCSLDIKSGHTETFTKDVLKKDNLGE